jgi:hypothetical protein
LEKYSSSKVSYYLSPEEDAISIPLEKPQHQLLNFTTLQLDSLIFSTAYAKTSKSTEQLAPA